jgi:hypothetical protein
MKYVARITLLMAGLVLFASLAGVARGFLPLPEFGSVVQAAPPHEFTIDVAVDCRTVAAGDKRGDTFIINGKLFPGGTFPLGNQSNDPIKPFNNRVAPIGDYVVRGQHAVSFAPGSIPGFPFPPDLAKAYETAPLGMATVYFLLKGGQTALIGEGYDLGPFPPSKALLTITGGIGDYSGAAGDVVFTILGRNITTCANSRATFRFQPGSVRGSSNK